MAQIFGLLVGVARYHPDSSVTSLTGCANDSRRMSEYIFKAFSPLPQENIRVIVNEQATRVAVIENFIEHLCDNPRISPGDTVLFFFSGHGSYATTSAEFKALREDTMGRDETLVLYDSRLPGNFDLADKELALLMSHVKPGTNIVVIADSCHSGSITRGIDDIKLGLPKFSVGDKRERQLNEYLTVHGKGYADLSPLAIPKPPHLVLSACDRGEVAYESDEASGLFTEMLLKLVTKSPAPVSYAGLYEHLYTELKWLTRQQTPQLFVQGSFNPARIFLSDELAAGRPGYTVILAGGDWKINYGALHGLDTDPRKLVNYRVALYTNKGDSVPVATCPIRTPGLDQSILDLPSRPGEKDRQFFAEVLNKTPSLTIWLEGREEAKAAIYSCYENSRLRLPTIVVTGQKLDTGAETSADYILSVGDGQLILMDTTTRRFVHGVKDVGQAGVDHILNTMQAIEKWHHLQRLENKTGAFPDGEVEWRLICDKKEGEVICEKNEITLDLTVDWPKIPYGFLLKNKSGNPYYVALYHLSSDYGIERFTPAVDSSLLTGGTQDEDPLILTKRKNTFFLPSNMNEDVDTFKLIVSREAFSDYFLEQKAIPRETVVLSKASEPNRASEEIAAEWFVKTITVRTVRQGQRLSRAGEVKSGILSIAPHSSFEAGVTLTPIQVGAKDIRPIAALNHLFDGSEYTILNLDQTAKSADGDTDRSIVEFSGVLNEERLEADPLNIELECRLEEDEQAVALTYDGEFVYLLDLLRPGDPAGNKQICTIRHLPGIADDQRRAAAKSPMRAFWFCFLKVVTKKDDEVFKLRSIRYEEGKVKYDEDGRLKERVDTSPRILLLVHGIIGNTKSMAQPFEYLLTEKIYDLIIAFDYENLNTEIEKIADQLRSRLKAAGITTERRVDALVHSMGGLVCRYMIEKTTGDVLVGRMIMAGTPNGGSVFGELPKIRDWVTGVIGFGINFGMKFLGHWGPVIKVANTILKGTAALTHTLAEMEGGSEFLKKLNESSTAVPAKYIVVAGDTEKYSLAGDGVIKKFVEKSKLMIGWIAYGDNPNDIAVSVKGILALPAGYCKPEDVHEIGCHHLNYFEEPASLETLKQIFCS
ncbi:MAG TPA: caspase family protein [Puia sp.]|jgi:hypothetical protein|nr:caspase family protein [Puia sp.]